MSLVCPELSPGEFALGQHEGEIQSPRRLAMAWTSVGLGSDLPISRMRKLPAITVAEVLREGRSRLVDYPLRLRFRGVLVVATLAIVPASLIGALSFAGADQCQTGAVALGVQSALSLAARADRTEFHHWRLTGSLYRWSRQAQGDLDALGLLVDCANSASRALRRLQTFTACSWLVAALCLYIAPGFIRSIPCWIGIPTVAASCAVLLVAVRSAERALTEFIRAPSAWLRI